MAAAVHFLTHERADPTDSGGCSGFPRHFTVSAPPAAKAPISVSYLDLIKWYGRVKKWTLTTNMIVTATEGSAFFSGSPLVGTSSAASEIDLVQAASTTGTANANTTGTSFNNIGSANFNLFFIAGDAAPRIYEDSGLLYPSFRLAGSIQASNNAETQGALLQFSTDSTLGYASSITGTINGLNFTLHYRTVLDPGATGTISTAVLAPSEYWPFAAADASAIYDTTTGAQLQDPRN